MLQAREGVVTPQIKAVAEKEHRSVEFIQERVADGRVAVVMDILSPAMRTVQVTGDLAGFWRESYHLVRKEMRGRYPKHDWPEDPLQAQPHRGRTKRSLGRG